MIGGFNVTLLAILGIFNVKLRGREAGDMKHNWFYGQ